MTTSDQHPRQNGNSPAKPLLFVTHPRTASNLFQKILSTQPGVHIANYAFYEGALKSFMQIASGSLDQLPETERLAIFERYQESYATWLAGISTAREKGLRPMLSEHAVFLYGPDTVWNLFYPNQQSGDFTVSATKTASTAPSATRTNPTCLPDSDLLAFRAVFQIRNPMLMVPSMVRAAKATPLPYDIKFDPCLSLRYSRELFDWYQSQASTTSSLSSASASLVIDADDIMKRPEVVEKMCRLVGLDADALQYSWGTEQEAHPVKSRFKSTINSSTGIVPGLDSGSMELETERVKWIEELGDDEGTLLYDAVVKAMPDYYYLKSKCLTI